MLHIGCEISDGINQLPDRAHNKAGKESLRAQLVAHHRQRIPRHFRQDARQRYGHKPRTPLYLKRKLREYRSATDLVRTGRTRAMVTAMASVRIGGTVTGSVSKETGRAREPGLVGYLVMRMPFPVGNRDSTRLGRVTSRDLVNEILAVTADEEQEMAAGYRRGYLDALASYRSGPLRRTLYGAKH